jgi:hypothetical protein
MVLLFLPAVFSKEILLGVQYAKLYLFAERYEACALSAAEYSELGKVKQCSFRSEGDSLTMVFFDSGDNISLPKSEQSGVFKGFMEQQHSFLVECKSSAQRLLGHFYFVQAGC